ncbi:MAG: type VI secretion system membrane subunit TssM [Deltaproteobacteria bacterium]|jgi:type VI secretion system protein ImpL|nr:type VI secretion system membrane subunit TssM [Deltaproteobacteria bacterium]
MIAVLFRALGTFFRTPWMKALLVAFLLILCVWLAGPHIAVAGNAVLEGVVPRLVATVALVFCWGVFTVVYYGRRRKIEMADPEKAEGFEREAVYKSRLREETDHIRDKFKAALAVVTRSNFYGAGRRSRYTLPWYLLLGTADCGKTSLLLNSGLKFPLNEQADRHLYQLATTERCDMLYGNEAVFIDTPGAFTESRPESFPHQIWQVFLKRLFRTRPARPLNGIIVCASMRDIINTDAARREHLARNLRARLSDVLRQLKAIVPVYLVFTKCDAVPGFAQFFTHLQRQEREQIFGCLAKGDVMPPGSVRAELKDLLQTLNGQVIAKINQERDPRARGDMFRFPQELAQLGPRIEDFIAEAFGPSRYHRPVLFRGFFFTSALSAGDILSSSMDRGELAFQQGFQPSLGGEMAKGFFLFKLLQQCIIPEARLAGEDREQAWTLRFRRYGLQLAAAGLFLFLAACMGVNFVNKYSQLEALNAAYTEFAGEQRKTPVVLDARDTLPELATMEKATRVFDPERDSPFGLGLGLYQGKTLGRAAGAAYLGVLNARFLPALRKAAEGQITASLGSVTELKAALQAYLMLCRPEQINAPFLNGWLDNQWSERHHGDAGAQARLRRHRDYLLTNGVIPAEPDAELVERARKALLKTPLAELAYQKMKEAAEENALAPFSFRAAIGETPFDGDTRAIPGLYTRRGYEEYLLRRSPEIIRGLTDDSWIFGENPLTLSALDVNKVQREVRTLYFRDYTRHWGEALQELSVRTPATLADAQKLAERMTDGVSPVVLALREIRANTDFVFEQAEQGVEQTAAEALRKKARQAAGGKPGVKAVAALASEGLETVEELRGQAAEEARRDALAVRRHFLPLLSLLDDDGNPRAPLQAVQTAMTDARDYFAKLNASDDANQRVLSALLEIADEEDDALRALERSLEKLPAPVSSWYATTASGGLRAMLATGVAGINKIYQEKVVSVYNKTLRGSYPFDAASDKDANLDDFAAFFRAGGTLDGFHDAYLKPFVNRSGQFRSIMGHALPMSDRAVAQLQRATRVQDAFFMSGRELGVRFLMEPHALDADLKQVTLTNAGKTIAYRHGPVSGVSCAWPEENGQSSRSSLETTDLKGISARRATRGDWSLFRLFKGAAVKRRSGNTCLIEMRQNGKWVQFLIQFRNKANPFDPAARSFALPESLL